MTSVVKSLSTRSFFQLCSDLKREHYDNLDNNNDNQKQQLRVAVVIMLVFFVWAVYALIRYQRDLPGWVVVVGIVLLFIPAGPLLTLILVYYSVGAKGGSKDTLDLKESGGRHRKLRQRPNLCPRHRHRHPQ